VKQKDKVGRPDIDSFEATKDEAAMRGLVLGLLYANRNHNWTNAKPESFSPPLTKQEIHLIGRDFHEADIIKGYPSDHGDGYFMRISLHGQAIWTGKGTSSLDIYIPMNAPVSFLINLAKQQIKSDQLDEIVLRELVKYYSSPNCSPEDKSAIIELDRSEFIPRYGFTKLPPLIINLHGAKPTQNSEIPSPITTASIQSPSLRRKDEMTQQKEEKIPSTLEEGLLAPVWSSRFRWPIIGLVALIVISFAVFATLPDEFKTKIVNFFLKLFSKS
jgi:hypothetical protein